MIINQPEIDVEHLDTNGLRRVCFRSNSGTYCMDLSEEKAAQWAALIAAPRPTTPGGG